MANPAFNPFGLRPSRFRDGAQWEGQVRPYYVPSTNGTALYIGDPVVPAGGSTHSNANYVERASGGGYVPGSLLTVTRASAGSGNKILGVVVGIMPVQQSDAIYVPASTECIVLCTDADMGIVYQITDDGGGTLSAATVGLNAVLIASQSGSTTTGNSGWAMDAGTSTAPGSNAAYQLYILGVSNILGNDVTAKNAIWDVILMNPSLAWGVAGVS